MIPAHFDYEVADSVDHAIELLSKYGEDSKLIAGGQSLLPLMKLRLARPSVLIDLGRVTDLSYITEGESHIAIGARTRHHDLQYSDLLIKQAPLLAFTASLVGDPQVRHRGTIGGSVAHGDPASDLPSALLAIEADFVMRGPPGERIVPASDFFKGLFETALGPEEVLTEIRVPKSSDNQGWSYMKFNRRAQDWAIVGVAAMVERSNGAISVARISLTNMGSTPIRAKALEEALRGATGGEIERLTQEAPMGNFIGTGTQPPSDLHASSEFRQHLARILVKRAVEEALVR